MMKRRDFLKTSALVTAAMTVPLRNAAATAGQTTVKKYQSLGKTGLKMSDISLGCGQLPAPSLVLRAIDRGINYLDTAPDYGPSEDYIGEAMSKIQRDKIILASKFCRAERGGHLAPGSRKEAYIHAVEESLTRLKTDYLDICFVHAIGSVSSDLDKEKARLFDEGLFSAVEALKKAGKIRFLAVSSHGEHHMEELLMAAVKSGHYDVIMPSFNFMTFFNIPLVLADAKKAVQAETKKDRSGITSLDLIKEAKQRGVGVVAMKTLAGARDLEFEKEGVPFQPAAFKWTLSHPEISGLVVTIKTVAQLDLYLSASGESLTAADRQTLDRYAETHSTTYCRTGCSHCGSICPKGVEMAKALRYHMYFKDYGMEKRAMGSYGKLTGNAGACATCQEVFCDGLCPYGLPLQALLQDAHETLSFTV